MMTKTCTKCGQERLLDEFNTNKGKLTPQCKICYKKYREANPEIYRKATRKYRKHNHEKALEVSRNWKQNNKDRIKEYDIANRDTIQYKARKILAHAVERGDIIKPDKCSNCGKICNPQGHHEDYNKPLDVEWLCRKCHGLKHRKN